MKVKGKPIEPGKFYEARGSPQSPTELSGAEALTEVAVTEAMSQGKFGYPWMAEAERIVDSESGMQIQDPRPPP